MMTKTTSRTQLRAICPACFEQQALVNGRMSQHGYRRPQNWHQNVNTCHGAGRPHFGTPEGRQVTLDVSTGLLRQVEHLEKTADGVLEGTLPTYGRKRTYGGAVATVVVENPTYAQRSQYAASLRAEAAACRAAAADFSARAADWQPAEPVEVKLEEKAAPVHFRATWYIKSGHKACAGSAMGAMRGYATMTLDPAKVTCERCKACRVYAEALVAATEK